MLNYSIFSKIKNKVKNFTDNFAWGSFGNKSHIKKPCRISGKKHIFIEDNVNILDGVRLEAISSWYNEIFSPRIEIHSNVNIEQNVHITSCGNLVIGCDTSILANVFITDIIHNYKKVGISPKYQDIECRRTFIGPNCMIGMGAAIMPGTILPDNCIVGANSFVKGVFPPHCVIAGSPAKIIKQWNPLTDEWERQ